MLVLQLLLQLASAECYFSSVLFSWKEKEEGSEERRRYDAAVQVCQNIVGKEEPQNLEDFEKATEEFHFSGSKVLFYTHAESQSLDMDLNKVLNSGKDVAGWPRVKAWLGGDGPITVNAASNSSAYPQEGTLGLELLSSVSKMVITNDAEGMTGTLVASEFDDRSSQCVYVASDPKVVPLINAEHLVLSDNLRRRRQEGSVTFIGQYYDVIVDENMLTGDISGLAVAFPRRRDPEEERQGEWTVIKRSFFEALTVCILVRAPVNLTAGRLSTKLETEGGSLFIDMGTEAGYIYIDIQDESVEVNCYCEDGVPAKEFIGAHVTLNYFGFEAMYLVGTTAPPESFNCKLKLRGDNWPYTGYDGESEKQIRTETSRDTEAKTITVTTYYHLKLASFYIGPICEVTYFSLTDRNLPVTFTEEMNYVISLEGSNVGTQNRIGKYPSGRGSMQVKMCEAGKCTLGVGAVNSDENGQAALTVVGEGDLTVVAKKCDRTLKMPDNVKLICESIHATDDFPEISQLKLADDGVLIMDYLYPREFPTLSSVWDKTNEHAWFGSGNSSTALWDDWTYVLEFIAENKKSLSEAASKDVVNRFASDVSGLNIVDKANVQVVRMETVPVAPLYSKSPLTVACLASGALNVNKWNMSFQSFLSEDSPGPTYFGQYFPAMSELGVDSFSLLQSASRSCLEVKIEQPPNSAFVFVVYASNKTYVDIVSAFPNYVTLVTDETIDSDVTISNPNCKNVVVLFLDSVPTGTSLRLGKVRSDGNVYAAGVPFAALDHVFKVIAAASDKDNTNVNEIIQTMVDDLVKQHSKFFPAVSITTNHINSLFVASANYIGTKVDCDNFYACGCTFPAGFSVSASYTLVDTFSYKSLDKVVFNNLCLFPVSTSPADHLAVSTVEYGPNGLTLKGNKGYFEFAGAQTNEVEIPVATSNVKGVLHLVTFTDGLQFAIPADVTVEKVKGISAVMGVDFDNLQIANLLPVLPLLSEEEEGPIQTVISALNRTFHAKTLATDKTVKFTGSWDKVKEIEGSFTIDAAADPVAVNDVPANVIQKLQVKSSSTADVTVPDTVKEIHMDTQVIKGQSQMSFGSSVEITFENLTFAAGTAGRIETSSFALIVQNKEVPIVANHVKCSDYVQAFISDLSIQKSVEVGRVASMQAGQLNSKEFGVTLHYSFEDGFSGFFDGLDFTPNALKLFYDGDGAGVDVESYRQTPIAIRTLKTAEKCNTWKSKVSYDSSNPDFAGSRSRVTASCTDNVLVLTLGDVKEDDPVPVGAIVGGVIGGLVVIGLIVAAVILILKKRKKDELNSHESSENTVSVNTD